MAFTKPGVIDLRALRSRPSKPAVLILWMSIAAFGRRRVRQLVFNSLIQQTSRFGNERLRDFNNGRGKLMKTTCVAGHWQRERALASSGAASARDLILTKRRWPGGMVPSTSSSVGVFSPAQRGAFQRPASRARSWASVWRATLRLTRVVRRVLAS